MDKKRTAHEAMGFPGLLERARAGDMKALNQLLAWVRPYLRKMAIRTMDQRYRHRVDPSDLAQQVLMKFDLQAFSGSREQEFLAYCAEALQHDAIDVSRTLHAQRRAIGASRYLEDPADGTDAGRGRLQDRLATPQTSPSGIVADHELLSQAAQVLETLPVDQKKAMGLHAWGYSDREIGDQLERSERAASALLKRARRALSRLKKGLR